MTDQQIYEMYRDQPSLSGESTRTLTYEYVKRKATGFYTNHQLCKNLMTIKIGMYQGMGMIVEDNLIETISEIADGYFPFVIFADIFVVSHNNLFDDLEAILDTADIIFKVIIDEYNKIVSSSDKSSDIEILRTKAALFIKLQTGIII